MRKALVAVALGVALMATTQAAQAAPIPPGHCEQHLSYADCMSAGLRWLPETRVLDRVRCEIPGNYRVVCYNFTPYVVWVRVNLFTTNGLYVRYVRIPYTRKVIWSPAYVNRITWRWWWA